MEQFSLFSPAKEKGSSEWSIFRAVADDGPGAYRVSTPIQKVPRRGIVVPIRRYRTPHQLFPKPAH